MPTAFEIVVILLVVVVVVAVLRANIERFCMRITRIARPKRRMRNLPIWLLEPLTPVLVSVVSMCVRACVCVCILPCFPANIRQTHCLFLIAYVTDASS